MKIRKRIGPKTDPWGTPNKTGTGSEAWPSKTTCGLRPESNELIHLWVDPRIPKLSDFCNSLLCGTLSKAFAKSMMIKSVCLCPRFIAPSRLLMISCTNWTNWVSQDLRLRNPCWQSASMLSKAKCLLMLLTNICSRFCNRCRLATPVCSSQVCSSQHRIFLLSLRPGIHLRVANHLEHCPELKIHYR